MRCQFWKILHSRLHCISYYQGYNTQFVFSMNSFLRLSPTQNVTHTHTHRLYDTVVTEVGGTAQRLSVIKVERGLKRFYCGFILFFHEGSIPPKLDKRILMGRLMDCD